MPEDRPARQRTRSEFSAQLAAFDTEVLQFFTSVTVAVKRATEALCSGDASEASRMAEGTALSQTVLADVERELEISFARQTPVGDDLRLMLTVLRVVPQLERCVELAHHIAQRATLARRLPADVLASLAHMGRVTTAMWESTTAAWYDRDADAADALDLADDTLDVLSDEIVQRLGEVDGDLTVAMEARLLIRFYERLGDQAVRAARRIAYLATGQIPPRPSLS